MLSHRIDAPPLYSGEGFLEREKMLNKNNIKYLQNIKTLFVNRDYISFLVHIGRRKLDSMLIDVFGSQPNFYKQLGRAREWAVAPRIIEAFIRNHSLFKDNRFMFFRFKTWRKIAKSSKKVSSVYLSLEASNMSSTEKQYVLEWWERLTTKQKYAILEKYHV